MATEEGRVAADVTRRQTPLPASDWARRPDEAVATGPVDGEPLDAPESVPARPAGARRPAARAAREIVETLLLALVIFLAVRLIVLNFRVDGDSMVPNLHNTEMLLVNRNAYFNFDLNRLRNLLPGDDEEGADVVYPFDPPERGDIVVFDPPEESDKPYIKRVIALPGETVSFQGGEVQINGQPLDEPYIEDGITRCRARENDNCEVTVPEGTVYVLGDNRDGSQDSRSFGVVDVDAIVGKAWFTYWPLDDLGLVPHYDYPGVEER